MKELLTYEELETILNEDYTTVEMEEGYNELDDNMFEAGGRITMFGGFYEMGMRL